MLSTKCVYKSYTQDLALNNLKWVICLITKPNQLLWKTVWKLTEMTSSNFNPINKCGKCDTMRSNSFPFVLAPWTRIEENLREKKKNHNDRKWFQKEKRKENESNWWRSQRTNWQKKTHTKDWERDHPRDRKSRREGMSQRRHREPVDRTGKKRPDIAVQGSTVGRRKQWEKTVKDKLAFLVAL